MGGVSGLRLSHHANVRCSATAIAHRRPTGRDWACGPPDRPWPQARGNAGCVLEPPGCTTEMAQMDAMDWMDWMDGRLAYLAVSRSTNGPVGDAS